MAEEKVDKLQARIDYENSVHKGEWLTKEVCLEYIKKAAEINEFDSQDIRRHKELREELQAKYGVTQIEAINILNGCNISDYVNKYRRIMEKKPLIDLKAGKK